ncbi:SIT4-associating protein ser/thr phosphatase [Suhomyces tanzawaensis NRRL Y-17324]|uniref:SIT4-associating protein ser/thr phosphatase n=1 Tax=Suhomyces tanzawaensis NRRL Y-17324 TaxID=984487 RepID=A0A1E4SM84_9ASCO|nr:SIT4-associating protein ser/thr phosphatase [Suhomyces tanzawaensis NRRL Y-17324]ODV80598.1 SIT4-associating protein ser/thr phosphatase [Suhomyces tanzawaensis NRRL Y-17324]
MSGSFWKFSNGFTSLSNILTFLENHSISQDHGEALYESTYEVLLKLLDENDLLQELLSNNPMLLEFLREDDVLAMLVDLVINEGDPKKLALTDPSLPSDEKPELKNPEPSTSSEASEEVSDTATEANDSQDSIDADETDEASNDDDNDDADEESEEEKATRRATIAAEILSADVWSLTDTVMESTPNLNKLWSVLDSKSPLSINLSTYFMKIMEHLLDMKCDEMISYLIENQSTLVEKFMNHLSNSPLMDFLLKLISTDKPDNSTGIIDFLQNQDLITHLINALDITDENNEPTEDHDKLLVRQSSAADFLKALITISANSTTDNSTIGPSELTRELVSHEQMTCLCNIMLKGGYALANGVGIIIEIIRKNNSDYDILPVLYITLDSHPPTGRDPIYLGHLLKVFGSKIEDFNRLLMSESYGDDDRKLKTPFGEIEPLGFERFKICELIAELLHCSNMALLNDNKGFDVVKERDELRKKMKEYDPISFKYNEVIVLPNDKDHDEDNNSNNDIDESNHKTNKANKHDDEDEYVNDTIDSFNSKLQQDEDSIVQHHQENDDDEEEPHANANLTEEQIRANPVIGDYLKIALFDTQIITNILSMFFKFPWNNFLHNVVFDIVQQVLNGSMGIGFNKFLAIDLFHLGDITNKIIEGQKLCSDYEDSHNGLRLGFMGHLTLIAEEVVKFIQLYPANSLSELIDVKVEDDVWEDYVSNVLYDTREKYNAILGGGEEDEDEDEEDENNTFDEGLGEIIEEVKTGLVFDDATDHDLQKDRLDSDESESDDDDHFTNYMSHQLINTASTEISSNIEPSKEKSISTSDEKEQDGEGRMDPTTDDFDHEDYIDPNDDGVSYKRTSSLYDATGSFSSSSDNDDDINLEDDGGVNDSTKLTRAASKG